MLTIVYRISDAGNPKEKLTGTGSIRCLENCLSVFGKDSFILLADHCRTETLNAIRKLGIEPIETQLGNALSWRHAAQLAFSKSAPDDHIYFIEDDYLHLPQARTVLLEGLTISDYVSLYDHPDKYQPGVNPFVQDGGETGKILLTPSCHWKTTNSTTMTFAVKARTLNEDMPVWLESTSQGYPNDFEAFQKLSGIGSWENQIFGKGRRLITPIPGFATHTETAWLSPLQNWNQV